MFKKTLCFSLIAALLVPDLAKAVKGIDQGEPEKRPRSLSVQQKNMNEQRIADKKYRSRSKSLPDVHALSKNLPIHFNPLLTKTKPVISLNSENTSEKKSSEPIIEKPKDCSNSNGSTITTSSTSSSPREDDTSYSSKDSRESSPTKSSEDSSVVLASQNLESCLETEPPVNLGLQFNDEDVQQKTEGKKILSDILVQSQEEKAFRNSSDESSSESSNEFAKIIDNNNQVNSLIINNKNPYDSGYEGDEEIYASRINSRTNPWTDSESEDVRFKTEKRVKAGLSYLEPVTFTKVKEQFQDVKGKFTDGKEANGSSHHQINGEKIRRTEKSEFDVVKNSESEVVGKSESDVEIFLGKDPGKRKVTRDTFNAFGSLDDEASKYGSAKSYPMESNALLDLNGRKLSARYSINGEDKFVPDCLKSFIEKENISNIQISLKNDNSEEESSNEGPVALDRARQYKLDQLLNDLPPEAKTDLKEMVNIWEKGIAMLVGAGIGGATAYATSDLYVQSVFDLATRYDRSFRYLLVDNYLSNYILITTLFDAVFRNALYGKKVLTGFSRRVVDIKDAAFYGMVSILPSLLTPFALISADFEEIKAFQYAEFYVFIIQRMKFCAPVLFLNDWAFNINMTSEIRTNMKNWAEKSDSCFARLLSGRVFYTSLPSEEEMRKRRFNEKVDILIHKLPSQSDEKVREIYDNLKSAKTTIAAELPELEDLEAGVKFLTFRYVLSLGHGMEQTKQFPQGPQEKNIDIDELKQEQKSEISCELEGDIQSLSSAPILSEDEKQKSVSQKKDWYEIYDKTTDILIGSSLVLGSPARLITMMYVVQESLKALMYNSAEVVLSGPAKISSGIFASLTGFPIQTGFEYRGMKNFAKMVWSREDQGHESYAWTRKAIKLVCVGQGFVLSVPALILGLQACTDLFGEDWLKDPNFTTYKWMTLTSIFNYFFAEWAVQTTVAEEFWNKTFLTGAIDGKNQYLVPAYNRYILPTLKERIQPLVSNYIDPLKNVEPNRAYHQDWLIRFFKDQQEEMNYLHPQIHFELEKLL